MHVLVQVAAAEARLESSMHVAALMGRASERSRPRSVADRVAAAHQHALERKAPMRSRDTVLTNELVAHFRSWPSCHTSDRRDCEPLAHVKEVP